MSKYSLVKLMLENEEDSQSSGQKYRGTYDLLLTPTNATIEKTIEALSNPKYYKAVYATIPPDKLENHFGPVPRLKQDMEDTYASSSKEEWMDRFRTKKGFEEKYETLSKNNGKFYVKTAPEMQKFKDNLVNPNKFFFVEEGDSLRFPQSKNSELLQHIVGDLKKILTLAKITYKISEIEA